MSDCIFCDVVQRKHPAQIVRLGSHSVAITPSNAVVEGHVVFIPYHHVRRFDFDPHTAWQIMSDVSTYAQIHRHQENLDDYTVLMNNSAGAVGTGQHLHVHLIPRTAGDVQLTMPSVLL